MPTEPEFGKRSGAVTSDIETTKAETVERAGRLAATRPETGESGSGEDFIAAFYEHAPPADIAARDAEDLCGGALALSVGDRLLML